MDISAKVTGISYTPFLCRQLRPFNIDDLAKGLASDATFLLNIGNNQTAVSWWRSAKRTRSYPYARVYDSLAFAGKKVTIIPVFKDEGKDGDRDFLQWDTVSLMSLLGVYVIISYYKNAKQSSRYEQKITEQEFDIDHIKDDVRELLSYQSDAMHWNLKQIDKVGDISQRALVAYTMISSQLGVPMHSRASAQKRIAQLLKSKDEFLTLSRQLAEKAQKRERVTIQPKERLSGDKAIITISNYLRGYYYFTADEAIITGDDIYLIEGKHSKMHSLPSQSDIKDALLKMILFTNLKEVMVDNKTYNPILVLKLTVESGFQQENMSTSERDFLQGLKKEAEENNFQLRLE